MADLPTNYVDGDTVHATSDTEGGGGIDAWMAAINQSTDYLAGTKSGAALSNPTVTGYTETVSVEGTVASAHTLSLTTGTVKAATLTASTACTFTMPTPTAGASFVLLLKQAATTGGGTAVFTGVKWSGGTAPTQTATAATMDIYTFLSDGTDWYGSSIQNFTP